MGPDAGGRPGLGLAGWSILVWITSNLPRYTGGTSSSGGGWIIDSRELFLDGVFGGRAM